MGDCSSQHPFTKSEQMPVHVIRRNVELVRPSDSPIFGIGLAEDFRIAERREHTSKVRLFKAHRSFNTISVAHMERQWADRFHMGYTVV